MGANVCNMGYEQNEEGRSELGIYSFKRDVIFSN